MALYAAPRWPPSRVAVLYGWSAGGKAPPLPVPRRPQRGSRPLAMGHRRAERRARAQAAPQSLEGRRRQAQPRRFRGKRCCEPVATWCVPAAECRRSTGCSSAGADDFQVWRSRRHRRLDRPAPSRSDRRQALTRYADSSGDASSDAARRQGARCRLAMIDRRLRIGVVAGRSIGTPDAANDQGVKAGDRPSPLWEVG